LLHAQEFYNATLLKTPEFKAAMSLARVLRFFKAVVQHLEAPTSSPSSLPTVNFGQHTVGVTEGDALVIGMSASFGFLFIGTDLI
jgi:hypothetical protein